MNLNKLYLVGTLKTDPETRETHSGSSVTRIVVTVHRDYFSRERNQRVRESDSFEVQAWGPLGQQIAAQFKKGAAIFIEGRLKQDSWETPTGERRQRTVVHAENFAPVGAKTGAPEGAEAAVAASDEGPTPTAGAPGAPGTSGKRKRRRRRGPRRDGLPAGPVTPQTPEERAAFAAGIVDASAGAAPQPSGEAPAAAPKAESAPPPPPAPPAPPAPPPQAEKPKPAGASLKEDMPF